MVLVMSIQKNMGLTFRQRMRTAREKRPRELQEEAVESFLATLQHLLNTGQVPRALVLKDRQLMGSSGFCFCQLRDDGWAKQP